jgi:menaquinone-9 beta-reductase
MNGGVEADVIVVGGGPAGSVTAMLMARAGYHVILLERHNFPRAKACGDCLSPGANRVLRRIGVWDDVVQTRPAFLRGWKLTSPAGRSFAVDFDQFTDDPEVGRSVAIQRDRFDAVLLDRARQAGVHIVHGAGVREVIRAAAGSVCGVRAHLDDEPAEFLARFTVGADGLRSVIARRLGAYARAPRLRKTSFTLHTALGATSDIGEMRLLPHACLGIAPTDDNPGGLQNVTLVLAHGSFDPRLGARRIVEQELLRFDVGVRINENRILASGPFDWPVREVVFDGAALVGDAAGYYDPFTGQGIYQALAGAELLAEHLDAALRAGAPGRPALLHYQHAHFAMTRSVKRLQRIIELVCARPRLADFAFKRFAHNPPVARALLAATGDLIPADSLFSARFLMRLLT